MSPSRTIRRNRPLATTLIFFAVIYIFWLFQPFAIHPLIVDDEPAPIRDTVAEKTSVESTAVAGLVPLEAHIISKCPDTKVSHRAVSMPSRRAFSY